MGLVEVKSQSWMKHAIRRWKQFYHEILFADGQIDDSNPLSMIFRNEVLSTKLVTQIEGITAAEQDSLHSKKEESPHSQPEKTPPSKPERKQSKGRFIFKIKELQCLLTPFSFGWTHF